MRLPFGESGSAPAARRHAMEVDYFREELLPALKELLLNRADSTEYTLYQVLEEAKAPLTTFLDLAPRDSKEKQDIESGE